ncbi:MAG TPA: hypothetical protein VFQ73_13190 [Flavisolibacter sp.]|nr:hypothetical protein [Flavisolibacter sp.]
MKLFFLMIPLIGAHCINACFGKTKIAQHEKKIEVATYQILPSTLVVNFN